MDTLIGIVLIAIGLVAIIFGGKKLNVYQGRIMKIVSLRSSSRTGIILVNMPLAAHLFISA